MKNWGTNDASCNMRGRYCYLSSGRVPIDRDKMAMTGVGYLNAQGWY